MHPDTDDPEPVAHRGWATLAVALMLLSILVAWTEPLWMTFPVDGVLLLWNMRVSISHALERTS